jgi:hypothetical protein
MHVLVEDFYVILLLLLLFYYFYYYFIIIIINFEAGNASQIVYDMIW